MPTPLLIDCDPGVDDMVAILLACASPELQLIGVTTVCGNVGVDRTTANALAVLALAGRDDVPVASGAARPLIKSSGGDAGYVHGDNGLGGVEFPPPDREPDQRHAVDFLADAIANGPGPVVLIATGPLTNLALLYARYPDLASRLQRIVIMGGAIGAGNVSRAAEFNIWSDPEAAYRVLTDPGLARPVPTVMIGLDVASLVTLESQDLDRLRWSGPVGESVVAALGGQYLKRFTEVYGREEVPVYDAVAVVAAVCPDLVTIEPAVIDVDTTSGANRGATNVSLLRDGRGEDGFGQDSFGSDVNEVGVDGEGRKIAEFILNRLTSGELGGAQHL